MRRHQDNYHGGWVVDMVGVRRYPQYYLEKQPPRGQVPMAGKISNREAIPW